MTRKRCWYQDWVLEFDIKGLFDNISHELLMKAVCKHTDCKWLLLYIERWLKTPMINNDGEVIERIQGTPQGGVVSPVLANLFLHYVFDKTKIVYCKDGSRKGKYENISFDFLGYTFRPRLCRNRQRESIFVSFNPAVSRSAQKGMIKKIRMLGIRKRTDLSLEEIAKWINPIINGWINDYGCFYRSELYRVFRQVNKALIWWARHKYKKLQRRKTRAGKFMDNIATTHRYLFAHWRVGMKGSMV